MFTGRLHFKQYIKNKPTPWGIKVWCAADSASGYLLDFSVYCGKSETSSGKGLGYDVIMGLGQRFLDRYHHFFYDNFFASVHLVHDLLQRGTYSCATIRPNRKGWPKDLSVKTKGLIRMRQIGNLVACFWFDKRPVNILSTNSNPTLSTVSRRSPQGRIDKDIPTPIDTYNQAIMGGVDLHDQYRAYYPVGHRSRKWWRCLTWFLLQVAIINAYQLYCAINNKSAKTVRKLSHFQFRLDILRGLKAAGYSRQRATPEQPNINNINRGSDTHTPVRLLGRKKTCFHCRTTKKQTPSGRQVETCFGCSKCQVHLCRGACFSVFHENLKS